MLVSTSATSDKLTDAWMSLVQRMMKDQESALPTELMLPTRDGKFCTKTSQLLKPRDLTRTSDSRSTDHSISSQDYQPTESSSTEVDINSTSSNGS